MCVYACVYVCMCARVSMCIYILPMAQPRPLLNVKPHPPSPPRPPDLTTREATPTSTLLVDLTTREATPTFSTLLALLLLPAAGVGRWSPQLCTIVHVIGPWAWQVAPPAGLIEYDGFPSIVQFQRLLDLADVLQVAMSVNSCPSPSPSSNPTPTACSRLQPYTTFEPSKSRNSTHQS